MYHSGVAGGGFMLIRSPNSTYESIDFRESAPGAAFENMFKDNVKGALVGGLARLSTHIPSSGGPYLGLLGTKRF